jgi:Ca-activated chloride channel family protein
MARKQIGKSAGTRGLQQVALWAAIAGLIVACFACGLVYLAVRQASGARLPWAKEPVTFQVAYSPEKGELLRALIEGFNATKAKTDDGRPIRVEARELSPESMIQAAAGGEFHAISPDSSIWLDALDRAWMDEQATEVGLVGETVRYGVSPVVLAMWEDVARDMGYPQQAIGWGDLLAKAQSDPEFRWSHPSTSSASGLLATLAEFYAAVEKTRGLTEEDAKAQPTLDYVSALEKTVRYYGEGEWAVVQQALSEGRAYLDAFVCQEQLVVYFNQRSADRGRAGDRLVAIYPREGTLWEDHPLALLELPDLSPEARQAFGLFRDFVLSEESQHQILAAGYRPADLSIPLDSVDSPLMAANGVDPAQPQTTLQVPNPAVIEVVRDVWWYTKRHTNVYLVVDTSGSMQGTKLSSVQVALEAFLDSVKGDQEQVGLIDFSHQIKHHIFLDELGTNRGRLGSTIAGLEARGDTALLDAVTTAYVRLQDLGDAERINAIVAMTDGLENASRIKLPELSERIRSGNQQGVPVVIFCIAYGSDADLDALQAIADASGGQVRRGDLTTIEDLYKILSTYF